MIAPELKPTHEVVIRSDADGWNCDLKGIYRIVSMQGKSHWRGDHKEILYAAWVFDFEGKLYPTNFEFKFLVDGVVWSSGLNLKADLPVGKIFRTAPAVPPWGEQIDFPQVASRPTHDIEGLRLDMPVYAQQAFQSARKIDDEFDVIVIGGGFSGGVVANQLSNKGKKTLLLEMGTYQFPSHASNVTSGAGSIEMSSRQGDMDHATPFLEGPNFMLGGRSVFWAGIINRLMDWEMASNRWPMAIRGALANAGGAYFQKAETLLGLAPSPSTTYAGSTVTALQSALGVSYNVTEAPWAFDTRRGLRADVPNEATGIFNTVELLQNNAHTGDPGHGKLFINMGQMALQLHRQGDRVTEVECFDLIARARRFYKAKAFVLAAGSIESPKLAMMSGFDDALLGAGLTDHPGYHLGSFKVTGGNNPIFDLNGHAKLMIVPQGATSSARPFFGEMNINYDYWHRRLVDPALDHATRPTQVGFSIEAYSYIDLNDHSRIVPPTQPGGRARINYHWPYNADYGDYDALHRIMHRFREDMRAVLRMTPDPELPRNKDKATIQHAVGTMRMGEDAGRSVVNTDLRMHRCENLYVADASVFPYAPTAKPSLLMTALALRLADHLVATVP